MLKVFYNMNSFFKYWRQSGRILGTMRALMDVNTDAKFTGLLKLNKYIINKYTYRVSQNFE